MASAGPRGELTCSICFHMFREPISLPCGHSFCKNCIAHTWDTKEPPKEFTCPECSTRYKNRPELKKNIRLANLVDYYRPTKMEQPRDGIFCSHCLHHQVPAVKSCLHCEASLCDDHLRIHNKSPEHILSDPSNSLEKRKCSIHKKILEFYCTEDSTCVCICCRLDGVHQGHNVQTVSEVSKIKKDKVWKELNKLSIKKREMEKSVLSLQERRDKAQEKARGVTERVTALFADIRRQLDDLERRVMTKIFSNDETIRSVSDLIQQMEIRNEDLSRKILSMEKLWNATDPLTVVTKEDADREELCDSTLSQDGEDLYVGDLDEGLISEMIHTGLSDLLTGIKRGIYAQGPAEVLMDVSTAASDVYISDDLKTVTLLCEGVNREDMEDRFQDGQVFSIQSVSSGLHYWEVETSELGDCVFGVAYPNMDRGSAFGSNNKSWCMCKWHLNMSNHYLVAHNNSFTDIPQKVSCNRFGVYLDYEAGRLSFYELSIPIQHLHTFNATFTKAVHPVFGVSNNGDQSSVWIRVRN